MVFTDSIVNNKSDGLSSINRKNTPRNDGKIAHRPRRQLLDDCRSDDEFYKVNLNDDNNDDDDNMPESRDMAVSAFRLEQSIDRESAATMGETERLTERLAPLRELRKLSLIQFGSGYHDSSDGNHYVAHAIPVVFLTNVLQEAKHLLCIELYSIDVTGSLRDFEDLARALEAGRTCLRVFSMEHCRLEPEASQASALEPVARALASLPSMIDVTLVAHSKGQLGTLSSDIIAFLCRSPSLQVLRLHFMVLHDEHATQLARTLESNEVLRILKFSCRVGQRGSSAIARMLMHNKTLEKLDLTLDQVGSDDNTVEIARALQSASTLKQFDLNLLGRRKMSQKLCQAYADLMEAKVLLDELHFSSASVQNCPFLRLVDAMSGGCLFSQHSLDLSWCERC